MATNKTLPTSQNVNDFIHTLSQDRQADSELLIELMSEISNDPPVMWGSSIIGFGTYTYTYASGRTGDWMKVGFSPRKAAISLYTSCDASEFAQILSNLGPHTTGKGCIYIRRLSDIDMKALKKLLRTAYQQAGDYRAG